MPDDDLLADPEDPYPGDGGGSRKRRGEGIRVPEVDGPTAPSFDGSVTDSRIATLFVAYVVLCNVIVLLVSLGAMLIGFRGQWTLGGQLIAVGVILALYGAYRYPNRNANRE